VIPEAELDRIVDNAVCVLTLLQPTWIGLYDPLVLPVAVRELIVHAEAEVRSIAEGAVAYIANGGIRVEYAPSDGQTTVLMQIGASWDEPEEAPDHGPG
jgi:hypothetical protein